MTPSSSVEIEGIEKIFLGLSIEAQKQLPPNLQRSKKKVLVIAGPTACGKSELAHQICHKMGGEIVSADSIQVYRGMDVGTAKPSLAERECYSYHLVDIREVNDPFNVVDFYYEARHACQNILNRDKIPVIVGGSGFYLHSLIYGPPSGPPPVPDLRKSLEDEMRKLGAEALYLRLEQLDLEYARTITKFDKQKIIRALEIITLTNKKVSKLSWKERHKPMNYNFRCWFFNRPREILYKRIEKRCDLMVEQGLIEEVEKLIEKGIQTNISACQAIGYRQALDYLATPKTKADFERFVEEYKQASRQYAKRQLTWFRKQPMFRWIDLETHDPEVVMDIIEQDFEQAL